MKLVLKMMGMLQENTCDLRCERVMFYGKLLFVRYEYALSIHFI